MTCKSKEQHWQEMCTCVAHMKDKLGKEVDAGIIETVVVLNLLGMPTTMSSVCTLLSGESY